MLADLFELNKLDSKRIFANAGINLSELRGATHRIPISQIRLLWRQALAAGVNPSIGFDVSRVLSPISYNSLSMAVWSSGTLRGVLDKYVRYAGLVSDAIDIRLERNGDTTAVVVNSLTHLRPNEAVECCLASILANCRQLHRGGELSPIIVELQRREPSNPALFIAPMGAPVTFLAPATRMVFRNKDLDAPLRNYCVALEQQNLRYCDDLLRNKEGVDWSDRVRCEILRSLAAGDLSEKTLARGFNTSIDTLRRRLKADGVTYREVVDDTRHTLAVRYLEDETLSVKEISTALGYTNPSGFVRAFRRWTGLTPGAWRDDRSLA